MEKELEEYKKEIKEELTKLTKQDAIEGSHQTYDLNPFIKVNNPVISVKSIYLPGGTVTGGLTPYYISIDGTNFYEQSTNGDLKIENLPANKYDVIVKDSQGSTLTYPDIEVLCGCGGKTTYQIRDYTVPDESKDFSTMTPFDIMVLTLKRIKAQFDLDGTFFTDTELPNVKFWTISVFYHENYVIVGQSNGHSAMYGVIYKYRNLRREIILQCTIFDDNKNINGIPVIEDRIYEAENLESERYDKTKIIPYNI